MRGDLRPARHNWQSSPNRRLPITPAPLACRRIIYGLYPLAEALRALACNTASLRGALHTDAPDVVLTYIYRPAEEEFPPYFDQALIARLAAEFTIPVTESTSRAETLFRLAEREYERARQIDAQQDTPSALSRFPLTDVRG